MTYTFKLSRRLAVARASMLALILGLAACGAGQVPTASSAPDSPPPGPTNSPVPAVAFVHVTPSALDLQPGDTARLAATPEDGDGAPLTDRPVVWATSDSTVVTVSASGTVRAISHGSASITATSEGKSGASSITASAAAVPPTQQRTLYGLHMDLAFNGNAAERTRTIQNAVAIKTQISRNSFAWSQVEPTRGNRDWRLTDSVVDELIANGIEPLMVIYGSPSWANGVSASVTNAFLYVPTEETAFAAWVTQYASFAGAAAARYRGKVRKWELWNEENQHYFWKPSANVDQYVRWYTAVAQAIKAADPGAEVAVGGLAGLCCAESIDYNGKQFLELLYQHQIVPEAVAVHPYALSWQAPDVHIQYQNNFDDIELMHGVMIAHGQADKPIWVTEWGWPVDHVTEAQQAQYVARSLEMIKTLYPYVKVATYFLDHDHAPTYMSGLYTADFRLREAGVRFRDFSR